MRTATHVGAKLDALGALSGLVSGGIFGSRLPVLQIGVPSGEKP